MKNKNKGFTLAEVLVVVAIIAILITLIIPYIADIIKKTRATADNANLRSAISECYNYGLANNCSCYGVVGTKSDKGTRLNISVDYKDIDIVKSNFVIQNQDDKLPYVLSDTYIFVFYNYDSDKSFAFKPKSEAEYDQFEKSLKDRELQWVANYSVIKNK